MKLKVLGIDGNETGRSVELADDIFGIEPNNHLVYLAVKQYRNNQRQGTSDSRERSDVKGSRRKIKRQKGTGTARAGDIKSPLFRGGGRVFGPHPRDYYSKMNKKERSLALNSALSMKASDSKIIVVEAPNFEAPKTKDFKSMLSAMGTEGKVLFLTNETNKNLALSARNIPNVQVLSAETVNTYKVMEAKTLIIAEDAAEKFNNN